MRELGEIEREERIRALLPLVRRIAKRVYRMISGVEYADLVGDGCIGLIRAVDGYDPSRGTSLEQYARRLILGKILHGVRRMDPVAERTRRELREAAEQRYAIAVTRGSIPTLDEMQRLRSRFGAALQQFRHGPPLSLDHPLPDFAEIPYDWADDPASIVARKSNRDWVRTIIATLPERQRNVVRMHYFAGVSFREIGRRLTISPQRASQLHVKALHRLRRINDAARP